MTMLSGPASDRSRNGALPGPQAREAYFGSAVQKSGPPSGKLLIFHSDAAFGLSEHDDMPKSDQPVTIKKYANRRLYNTGTSTYVTLEDLAVMVKKGEDFVVFDAKTGEEITRSVLTQIIFEQENKEGQNLLPINFLRQLIRFYGDSMQMLVPRFLEASIESLTREQGKFRDQMAQAFGVGSFGTMEEQVRRNMEMFQRTFAMFAPFARREAQAAAEGNTERSPGELDELKRQLNEMQKRLDRMSDKDKA